MAVVLLLLASPWASGGSVRSVDAARPDEPFEVRLLAGAGEDDEPSPPESIVYSMLEVTQVSSPLTSPLDQLTETPASAALPRLVPGPAESSAAEVDSNDVPPGQTLSSGGGQDLQVEPAAASLLTSFAGLSSGDNPFGLIPPDPQLAAGPGHLIEMINVSGKIYDKTGTAVTSTFSLGTFFGVPPGYDETDPKVIYDAVSGRFFSTYVSFCDDATLFL
ncbi:MAG: hypothetical protein IIC86_03725 [Chloroflexi bacterium]|nr:hypothetical protein [Chloroflexota bacterium]